MNGKVLNLRIKKNVIMLASLFFISSLLSSCASIKEPDDVFTGIDYTQEDARMEEQKRIRDLLGKNALQALWRSYLLKDDETISECEEKLLEEFDEAVKKEDWYSARRISKSFTTLSSKALPKLSKSLSQLEELSVKNVPGLSSQKSLSAGKPSEYINGTVTIWVDKGIRVERGMGFADRVIGSGFFISKNGYIVTNHHVIADLVDKKSEGFSRLFIKLAEDSDTRIPAKVIGYDPEIDLALIKTEVDAPYVFNLGSSEDLDVGDKIFAIGSPVGLERTLTSGIVSATDRKLFTLGSVMQIDAAVNQGNSGGPCIDSKGNVQSIVFAGALQYEGLNFAIPVEYLKSLLPALYAGGKVSHPWLGCFGHTKKELGKDAGLEVQYVFPGASASRAGMQVGDLITEFDGQKVSSLEDMQDILMKSSAKSIVKIKYRRGESEFFEKNIYLAVRPEQPGYNIYKGDIIAKSFVPIFGMKLLSVSTSSSKKYSIESIIKGSIADESGFSENDPVEIRSIKLNDDNSVIYAEIYAKNRKKGYLDGMMAIASQLDSPYYF
ncbi:trypsin-like peptidase domain-containing protein [uncultured Treponema sp.]|uniref:S1C family serine protease n=1 Tax=uncultured Treponema sp. TaxID=162155 RepID=UPI0025D1242B|nr:trypsin-like peptidase domain-containing protein [uncultured Treponema sp.]